jgi:hypothetical protein
MHLLAPPNRPSDIILPKSFQVEAFREEVEQLFTKYKKYTSSTVLGKLEDQMTEIFVETLTKPFNSNLKTKYALHHVFNMFPIDTFQYEAVTFCKAVELEVFHLFSNISHYLSGSTTTWTFLSPSSRCSSCCCWRSGPHY